MKHLPLKVGVVGMGIGRLHLRGYQALSPDDVAVVAVCDIDAPRVHQVATEYNIPLQFTDYQDMFQSGKIEAVSVCLPNSLHRPVSVAALKAGLHVLCEKPLAENAVSGAEIAQAAAQSKGVFMMCFNRRYRADVQWIRQLLQAGTLGHIYSVKAGWIRETGIPSGWFTNKAVAGGGPLIDLGVHMLDAVLWLLDYPKPLTVSASVQANFGPRDQKVWRWRGRNEPGAFKVEDFATAFIRLDGGTSLHLETSWAAHGRPGMDDIFITLLGTEGSVELSIKNYAARDTVKLYAEVGGKPVTMYPGLEEKHHPDHYEAVADFVRCLQEQTPPTATVEDGLTLMQIIDAIYKSAKLEREVTL